MAEHTNLYQNVIYYDIALRRDVSREVDFMIDLYRLHLKSDLRSVLDIGCGPGYHARTFSKCGIKAIGLDLRPEMINFARAQAIDEGLSVGWMVADMRNFNLDEPVDMTISMFDSIDALLTNDEIVQHFRTIANNLTSGGLYVIDYSHPRDCSMLDYGRFQYTGEINGVAVDIIWGTNEPTFDPITSVAEVQLEMHVNDHGQKRIINDSAKERLLTPQEIQLLTKISGKLQVIGWFGDFELNQPFDLSPASHRMIAVLQKFEKDPNVA